MSQSKWTDEHGQLLKNLRQNAGVDIATLARRHILSTTQIRQLEGGGDSAFYNPDIKLSIGIKLLHSLGHDLPVEVATVNPAQVPVEVANKVPEALAVETEFKTEIAAKLMPSSKPAPLNALAEAEATSPNNEAALKPPNFAWPFLFVLIALTCIWLYVSHSRESATAMPAAVATVETNAPAPEAAPSGAPVAPISPVSPAIPTVPEPTSIKPLAETAPKVTLKSACAWGSSETEIQPTSPRKSAEYVHMVAAQNVLVCVMDADQRVATLELQAGDARSIYGPAPFKVYSANLHLLKVYFQGQYMKLPSEDIQQIKLAAAR
jgi:transcriptional regulator with XRE-family HTH domain